MNCCYDQYSKKFDDKNAQQELRDYQKGNIKKSSRPLLDALGNLNVSGLTLIDIGGGIGVISLELLKRGVSHSTHIELSESYCKAFKQLCVDNNVTDKIYCIKGDYANLYEKVGVADIVCLDKVICCYANYTDLVLKSSKNANRFYAYVIPRDIWWVKLVDQLGALIKFIVRDPFHTFIHPHHEIERLVLSNGFTKRNELKNREWLTVLYEQTFAN